MSQPDSFRIIALLNGDTMDVGGIACAITKWTPLSQLLEKAADSYSIASGMNLKFTRVYMEDGREIFSSVTIPPGSRIYFSCGEAFISPHAQPGGSMSTPIETSATAATTTAATDPLSENETTAIDPTPTDSVSTSQVMSALNSVLSVDDVIALTSQGGGPYRLWSSFTSMFATMKGWMLTQYDQATTSEVFSSVQTNTGRVIHIVRVGADSVGEFIQNHPDVPILVLKSAAAIGATIVLIKVGSHNNAIHLATATAIPVTLHLGSLLLPTEETLAKFATDARMMMSLLANAQTRPLVWQILRLKWSNVPSINPSDIFGNGQDAVSNSTTNGDSGNGPFADHGDENDPSIAGSDNLDTNNNNNNSSSSSRNIALRGHELSTSANGCKIYDINMDVD